MNPYRVYPRKQVVYAGGIIYITCLSSTPPIWYKNGKRVKSDSPLKYALVIYSVKEEHNGHYTCHGTIKSQSNVTTFTAQSEALVGGKDKSFPLKYISKMI